MHVYSVGPVGKHPIDSAALWEHTHLQAQVKSSVAMARARVSLLPDFLKYALSFSYLLLTCANGNRYTMQELLKEALGGAGSAAAMAFMRNGGSAISFQPTARAPRPARVFAAEPLAGAAPQQQPAGGKSGATGEAGKRVPPRPPH